jgi:hypothetical protein
MRFKRVELSPANKRQYMIGLGVRDIELLLGNSLAATRSLPVLPEFKEARKRLQKVSKGLAEALEVAKKDGDEGQRVPVEERANYLKASEDNPMLDITRLEIIDHTPCATCKGKLYVLSETDSAAGQSTAFRKICPECKGCGCRGRIVVFNNENIEVRSSIQDNGKTLKLFLDERKKPESMKKVQMIMDKMSGEPKQTSISNKELDKEFLDFLNSFEKFFLR